MGDWYATQYKHAEIARTQNKREERLLQLEIDSGKYGMKNIHRYNLQAVEHEQRLIERELERIRKGMNKRPMQPSLYGNLTLFTKQQLSLSFQRRQENDAVNGKNVRDAPLQPSTDNVTLNGIVSTQRDPVAPLSMRGSDPVPVPSSRADPGSVDHSGTVPTSSRVAHKEESYTGRALSGDQTDRGIQRAGETSSSVGLVAGKDTLHRKSHTHTADLDKDQSIGDRSVRSEQIGVETDRSVKRRAVRDLSQLASLDIESVKSEVSKRLLQANPAMSTNDESAAAAGLDVKDEAKPKEKSRRISKSKVPTADAHKNSVTDLNPEHYNPDGSMKKRYSMPDTDKSWEQAKNARYIRKKDVDDCDVELSVEQIFEKKSKPMQFKY